MKKLTRLAALVLALVMCLSVTASASPTETDKAVIKDTVTGATVTFDTTGEKLEVTYESASIVEGQFYLVMVVAGDAESGYTPTADSILYINQTTGQAGSVEGTGKIVFGAETDNAIYPSDIKDSAILIYGTGIDGEANFLIAAIIDAKYIIGDVNGDGKVSTADLIRLAQFLAGNNVVSSKEAADTNADGSIGTGDLIRLARFLAGTTSLG